MSTATRDKLLDATLQVVAEQGIAKASARTIAAEAGVNQALVFYHFGSIDELLVAACEHGAAQRVEANRQALAEVRSLPELVATARQLHETERAAGHVALIGQLLAGAPSHGPLAGAVATGLGLWVAEVELVLTRLLADTPVADLVDTGGLARAIAASFVGLELYDGVDPAGMASALGALEQLAGLVAVLTDLGPLEARAVRRRLRRATPTAAKGKVGGAS
ncbi:TetR/AcrR family transcriptional regulator [Nocardioides humilatus]|uniref:TetR/AcrR family transcriptional regulator n=1 Tax=Nocardioides humilatus TaxID=2607660 RepID=A0A5B1L409_9ACTN|nr:TetR/AcrR family transcriptional regulator [Nocardioides humilatus]KAA1415421.1 TetR/AcrR family transcriptional regulator [Nocardioides humilatus]